MTSQIINSETKTILKLNTYIKNKKNKESNKTHQNYLYIYIYIYHIKSKFRLDVIISPYYFEFGYFFLLLFQ